MDFMDLDINSLDMKQVPFIKPDLCLYFAQMPLIGMFMKSDYEKANTREAVIDLFHRWMNIAEITSNEVKAQCYYSAARYIYSFFTNLSFDSKKFQEL